MRQCFDADWRFHLGEAVGAEQPAFEDTDWRPLVLPHDLSAEQPFSPECASGTGYLPGGIGWYRKTFPVPADFGDDELTLLFDGVYRSSDAWINGHHLGHRPYGYVSFGYRLTPYLRPGTTNTVAVRVAREDVADSRWYPGTGIYRHTWLIRTRPVHIGLWGVFVSTPRVVDARADVTASVDVVNRRNSAATIRVTTEIRDPDDQAVSHTETSVDVAAGATATASLWQVVDRPRRWSPDSPERYGLVTRLYAGRELLDEQRTRFGIRSFHFHPDDGFFLNGRARTLRGVCMHHDGGVVGAAVPEPVLARRLRRIKAIGGNAVRCSHNPMAPEFYDLCDRLGLLVMDEALDEFEIGKRKWIRGRNVGKAGRAGYATAFAEWGVVDCESMVRRDRNHPSIILWSIGNELDYPGDPYVHPDAFDPGAPPLDPESPPMSRLAVLVPPLVAAIKRYDPTRPVTMALSNLPAANAVGIPGMLDVVGYNYQEQAYAQDHRDFPGRVILGSENHRGPESWRAVRKHPFVGGQFLWVGFDFLGEAGPWPNHASGAGLFDTRGFRKPEGWLQQVLWSEAPTVRMYRLGDEPSSPGELPALAEFPRRWAGEPGRTVRVVIFSNGDAVELWLNERRVAEVVPGGEGWVEAEIPYEPGHLAAVGIRAGETVCHDRLETTGAARRLVCRLIDQAPVASGEGLYHVEVRAVDEDNRLVTDASASVGASVEGPGCLIGIDNGDTDDPAPLSSPTRALADGRLLALVKSCAARDAVRFTASAPDLERGEIELSLLGG